MNSFVKFMSSFYLPANLARFWPKFKAVSFFSDSVDCVAKLWAILFASLARPSDQFNGGEWCRARYLLCTWREAGAVFVARAASKEVLTWCNISHSDITVCNLRGYKGFYTFQIIPEIAFDTYKKLEMFLIITREEGKMRNKPIVRLRWTV